MFSHNPFGWNRQVHRGLLRPGHALLLSAPDPGVRTSSMLYLLVEWIESRRIGPGGEATAAVYCVSHNREEMISRLLCILTHRSPTDPSKLRRARELIASMKGPAARGGAPGRAEALTDDVRRLAGMWTLSEIFDYRRDPGMRPYWPDRARLAEAQETLDSLLNRVTLVDAGAYGLEEVGAHAAGLGATEGSRMVLVDSHWPLPALAGSDPDGNAVRPDQARQLATRLGATLVVSVAPPPDTPGGSLRHAAASAEVPLVEVSEGKRSGSKTLLLVAVQGSPSEILAYDSVTGVVRRPLAGEFL